MSETAIEGVNLSKSFGPVEVVHAVDIEVKTGEVHAILGENGAGKSTLMKMLAGYLAPSSGEILVAGERVYFTGSGDAEERGIVLIHQEFNLAEDLSAEENIFLGRELRRGPFLDRAAMRRRADELLQSLNSPLDTTVPVRRLAVSQKQMVEIAKAVSREVKVLFMDEPTDVLTGNETEVLFRLVRELKERGVAIVFVSHKLDEIKKIADRVTILRDGERVVTDLAANLSEAEMARLMVGRELADMYPPKRETEHRETVLEVRGMHVPGFVENASFSLRRGEVLGFAGLIGAGRTELLEGVLGLRPAHGEVLLEGEPVRIRRYGDAKRLGIMYLSEDRKGKGVLGNMPLRPNLTLASLELFARPFLDRAGEQSALRESMDEFDIRAPSEEARAGTLSGGNQQKLVLAKIMRAQPEIIVLDEPTRGIDVGTKRQIYFYMDELLKQGKSLILISSELPEIVGLAHRVAVMRSGRITGVLSGAQINEEEIMQYATGLKEQGAVDAAAA
ncbi:MAG TPA: sugar ABC transporter ATP-binding protein [Trueperaceae bacterium]